MMNISFVLNEKKITIQASPAQSLQDALLDYGLNDIKTGCLDGCCGACMVLLNDKAVLSCKVPLFLAKDGNVVTFGHFFLSEAYADIKKGFADAGIHLCGFCDAGKVLLAYNIIRDTKEITKEEVDLAARGMTSCCIDGKTFYEGILQASIYYQKRQNRRGAKRR